MKSKINLRAIVLTWTILTTTFFWTSTMRIFYKPEISSWSIFNFGGQGFQGEFWLLLLIVVFALSLFYLEGRGKLRLLYHILLLLWHLLITAVIVYGSLQQEMKISFGTWGVEVSPVWFVAPFIFFLILTAILVFKERRGKYKIPIYNLSKINWKPLLIAAALSVPTFIFFQFGSGFNWLVKIAVAITIVQWVLLIEALGRPYIKKHLQKEMI